MVKGDSHTNILFDVVVPYDKKITLKTLQDAMSKEYEADEQKYFFVLTLDREFA